MQTSKFEFSDPYLSKMVFRTNEDFSSEIDSVRMPIHININRSIEEEKDGVLVEIEVIVGGEDSEYPFYADIAYAAQFRWEEGAFTKEGVGTLLSKNAPALLLSYVRPALANITNFSRYPAYNLPFMDLTAD